ncbi:hypothetical protein ACJIZ3_025669 [Penstemon smallii]|uniref:LOB domain-containing protein n=1 Tax=Penstemon smallii TaxID=265156 RepID=A0ABD3TXR8_9LAMI
MDEPQTNGSFRNHPRGLGKRGATSHNVKAPTDAPPCGACKFLRRKCMINGCIFAPYFSSDQGAARFAAVHKVFGASNVSKLLSHILAKWRHDAVVTISYEAQARLSDPVHGCVSTIIALQQQLSYMVRQSQVINRKFAMTNALQNSNNLISINHFTTNFGTSSTALSNTFDKHYEEDQIHDPPVVFANHIFH